MQARLNLPESLSTLPHVYALPHGTLWQRRAHEILDAHDQDVARYLLRRIESPPSALVASAVLRHTSGLEHPRCWAPNFWARHEDAFWIATIRPLGEPLWCVPAPSSPRPWSEVVELWAPLAEAIRRGHQRGVVHAMITPWTVWYDEEAERLTAIEAGCWVGDALPEDPELHEYIAPELRCESAERSPSMLCDIFGLARLLMYIANPAVTHPERLDAQALEAHLPPFVVPALMRALAENTAKRLPLLDELIGATSQSIVEAYDTQMDVSGEPLITSVLGARITKTEPINHPRMGHGLKFYMNLPPGKAQQVSGLGEDEALGAFFYEDADRSLFDSIRWGWDGAQYNLLDARVITDSKGRRFVTSHSETLPVLEPNFPVSVSNVLKAERCTSRFLVDERGGDSSTRALVLGNMVHGLLEDLTSAKPPTFEQCFETRARSARLELLAAGLNEQDMASLERDARQHYTNLERFTRARQLTTQKAPPARLSPSPRWPTEETVYDKEPHHDMGWSGRHIEVTRYSPLYGLEGRIDLATQDDTEGVQIIELKSGSAWDGHLSQVRCYTLLWDGLARSHGVEVSGYVLYSRYGRLNAVPMEDISRERRILRARNELVACQRSFVDPTFDYTPPHYMMEPRHCKSPSCKFRRDRCREQTQNLGLDPEVSASKATQDVWRGFEPELVEKAWAYWTHYDRMVEMERWAQQTSLGKIFEHYRLQERINERRACEGMRITHFDLEKNLLTFQGRGAHIFQIKSAVLVHRGDLHADATLQGYVEDSGPNFVTLRSQGTQGAVELDPEGWILDVLPTRIGVRHAKRALYTMLQRKDPRVLMALLTPDRAQQLFMTSETRRAELTQRKAEADVPVRTRHASLPDLNVKQKEARDLAIHAPLGALIQGPPGTGKTTVIAQIVRELISHGERVLVCAQTNTAVDTMLSKVLDAGVRSFLRVGDMDRSPGLVHSLEMEGADPELYFTRSLSRKAANLDDLANALTTCPVYGATTHAAVRDPVFDFLSTYYGDPIFDVVIVDEASQLTEPMTLAAINHARRFVLVGDHRQLPPIVQSEQALTAYYHSAFETELEDAQQFGSEEVERFISGEAVGVGTATPKATFELPDELRAIGCGGLDRSLFERLITRLPHVMLEEQYRMHSSIMAYSNRLFYKGKLFAHESVRKHALSVNPAFLAKQSGRVQELLGEDHPVCFVHVNGEDIGRTNEAEAEAIVSLTQTLLDEGAFLTGGVHGPRPSIGIISPFKAQGERIRSLLLERLADRAWLVDVDTVERYQGGERDIILVSMVKTERAGDFLSDMRRMNVTLTRARKKLIVFGHRTCLELNARLRVLITQAETHVSSVPEHH